MGLNGTVHTNKWSNSSENASLAFKRVQTLYIRVCVCIIYIERNIHRASKYREPNLIELWKEKDKF